MNEKMNKGRNKRPTFLDLLIEMSEKEGLLTDADIREEVDTFMFEGHDTTSVAISWTLYLLGCHPEIQDKVVEELHNIFGDSDREAFYEDLQKMTYLEQVIKETLRLYPSVPGFSRILDVDTKIKNYTIPAGTCTPIFPFLIHRNSKVFPNPEEFNPDNFLPEKVRSRHPFSYIPFSAGPRNCIGQKFAMFEEKVVLSSVLRKLKVESLDKREDVPILLDMILRPKYGLRLKIYPRS
ncbi:Cytochrome P450 4C1 [Periplaneta americana]|uniref:Cytochrome P450 4C1 n=1 Tax=Periplaneta americana TaxID=6978 RepID=A0ABQ8TTZ0_PERAM|nr:Cytochrome P450 4C1 [Periplaneta americana]